MSPPQIPPQSHLLTNEPPPPPMSFGWLLQVGPLSGSHLRPRLNPSLYFSMGKIVAPVSMATGRLHDLQLWRMFPWRCRAKPLGVGWLGLILCLCVCCCSSQTHSSTKGTSFWSFLFGLSGFLKVFLCNRNNVPSHETARKVLQEYGGFLQECTT